MIHIFKINNKIKKVILLVNDSILSILSAYVALFLSDNIFINHFLDTLSIIILTQLLSLAFIPFFIYFGVYNRIIRYSDLFSSKDFFICFIYYLIFYFLILINIKIYDYSLSFFILYTLIFTFSFFTQRVLIKIIITNIFYDNWKIKKEKSILYTNVSYAHKIMQVIDEYEISYILTVENENIGRSINKATIKHQKNLDDLIRQENIRNLLIAVNNLDDYEKKQIIKFIKDDKINVVCLPDINKRFKNFSQDNLVNFGIEDIIEKRIPWNVSSINQILNKQNIMITGAGGSIGKQLCKQIIQYNPSKLILVENNEYSLYQIHEELKKIKSKFKLETKIDDLLVSVNDYKKLDFYFSIFAPQYVFHAAAFKHVPITQKNIIESFENNYLGTVNLAQLSLNHNIKQFIFISTDKAVNPVNVLGASKRMGEMFLRYISEKNQSKNTKFNSVRFGNVLGSTGSVAPLFVKQIKNGGPVTVTDPDVTRYLMSIREAVGLILETLLLESNNGIFILDMGKPIKILNLAKQMIKLSGYNYTNPKSSRFIEIQFTKLRDGEKLHEELVLANKPISTLNSNIWQEEKTDIKIDFEKLNIKINELINEMNSTKLVKLINENFNEINLNHNEK